MKHLLQLIITVVTPFTKCSLIVQGIFSKIVPFFCFILSQVKLYFLWDYFGQEVFYSLMVSFQDLFLHKRHLFYLFIFGCLGLRCCAWAFFSCGERGLLFLAVHGLLIAVSSLVAEHQL